jgi:hypothetical protein
MIPVPFPVSVDPFIPPLQVLSPAIKGVITCNQIKAGVVGDTKRLLSVITPTTANQIKPGVVGHT